MPAPPADRVDVTLLAAEGASIERRYALEEFPRLADVLAGAGGAAQARFRFFEPCAGVAACELVVSADALLRCQRCLQLFGHELRSTARLAFGPASADAGPVPEGFEELDRPAEAVSLRDLVEDELLLALPVVPRHGPGTACAEQADHAASAAVGEATETHRPFARLRDLLKH